MAAAAAEQLSQNQYELDKGTRCRIDTVTWLAETLNGSMRTSFEYYSDGHELYGEDGGAVRAIFEDAIVAAQAVVEHSPNLLFELRRRIIEYGECENMLAMSYGNLPNTMIVISDFPPELMHANEDIGGYNASRRQTMLRIITRESDGAIRFVTQSLDGSNRQALEAIYQELGEKAQPGELLGQRIYKELEPGEQEGLVDKLTRIYDASLNRQYGGSWHAGIRQGTEKYQIDTYQFANAQTDLVERFVGEKLRNPQAAEKFRYKLAAAAAERYEIVRRRHGLYAVKSTISGTTANASELYARQNLDRELEQAGNRAAAQGKVFSGCGASAKAEDSLTKNQLGEAGYGNRSSEKTTYKFDRKMHCVSCQAPPKKGEGKKMCGPCGLCRSCDKKFGGKG